ncbi:MAG: transglutaminase N-terminal domain-containing protein [Planctomycetaceae bacterium]
MRYDVTHTTRYLADVPVSLCHNMAWLTPRITPAQRCEQHELTFNPQPSVSTRRVDVFGNQTTHFSFNEGYQALEVTAVSRVSVNEPPVRDPDDSPDWGAVRERLQACSQSDDLDAFQFVFPSPRVPPVGSLEEYARSSFPPGRAILDAVVDLTGRIFRDFDYDPRATTVSTPVSEVMQHRRGVCQDFAHVEIGMVRSLGLAARYVSGYLRTEPPSGGTRLVGADASHAWLAVYCGELGWVDVDPTNNKLTGEDHITLAWGRDYSDVCPVKGVYVGGHQDELSVSVDVVPVRRARGGR